MPYNPKNRLKMPKEFSGLVEYNRLVHLRNRFKYLSTDLLRITASRRETIEKAILLQDVIDS